MRVQPGKFTIATFVAAATLAAAGCGGSSSTSGAQASTAPIDSPAATTGASTAPVTGGTVTASARASSAAVATTGAGSSSTGSSGAKASTTTAAKAPGKPSGFTRPGTYTYDLSGTAKQPIGGTQTVSGTQSYVVDAPKGSDQHSKSTGQQGSQDSTLQVRSTGLYVVDIHIAQQGFDEDFRPVGTALYFPASYHTGSSWSWRAKSTDGKYTIAVTTKVSGSTTQNVGGTSLRAVIVDSVLHITGNGVDIVANQRDWVSTTYALILKEHGVTKGTAFGAAFGSDITRQLRSTTPA